MATTLNENPMERTPDELMAEASRVTGLKNWGDRDIHPALEVLMESYREDGGLEAQGLMMIHGLLLKHLCNRLMIIDEVKRNPDILDKPVRRPLFIVALPRTGTTLLQRLLAADPDNRCLLHWEAMRPVPPPEPDTRTTDPRIAEAKANLEGMFSVSPDIQRKYPAKVDAPEECIGLLMNAFVSTGFQMFVKATRYGEWLAGQDMVPTYEFYKKQLQILQYRIPSERWLLKTPWHMHGMKALLTVFPDACVIQTHRDPLKLIPSIASLMGSFRKIFTPDVDLADVGREFLEDWATMFDRCTRARDKAAPSRFFDVHYTDLIIDPIGTVRKIYHHFDFEFGGDFDAGMKDCLVQNPQHKYGVHHYSMDEYGLNEEMINTAFASYCERFGISPE